MSLQNNLLLRAARGEQTERPPVWLMRQAGRILPQYRALRSRLSGFKELVETPALAAEVTIQPVDELSVDAAIIFSDILVIPEALGLTYEMVEKVGPRFPETIKSQADVDKLGSPQTAVSELGYVYDALALTKKELAGRVPLIGFAGAPWTLLAYMVEGGGSKTFSKARRFLYQEPKAAHHLLGLLTETTILYLQEKIKHGADLVQVFDSWAGILSQDLYREFALPYLSQIAIAIDTAPVTLFAKDAWYILPDLAKTDCNVIGLDWTQNPREVRAQVGPDKCLQGNLDPCLLYADQSTIQKETTQMLQSFGGGHIANLGHGVYPDTPLDGVRTFVNCVREFRYLGE